MSSVPRDQIGNLPSGATLPGGGGPSVDGRPNGEMRYPSRIDWWVGLPLFGVPVLLVAGGIVCFFFLVPAAIVLVLVGSFMGLSVAALSYPCVYVLREDSLEIKRGIGEERVEYRDIKTVAPITSVWAAEALSVYRVRIDCGSSSRLVSPKDREGFLRDLASRLRLAQGMSQPPHQAPLARVERL